MSIEDEFPVEEFLADIGMTPVMRALYADAYLLYRDRGRPPIKLGAGTKWPPPTGFTGRDGIDPSGADCRAWADEEPNGNLAFRVGADEIGIDVDAYQTADGCKTGGQTLAEAEKRWGRLPYSPRSTSRDDGVSGIRLYRIPAGVELVDRIEFPELGIGGIDIIQRHHRYVMCWPSINPLTRRQYQWLGIDDAPLDGPPTPADIPDLPQAWLQALTKPATSAETNGEASYEVRQALTDGPLSRRVAWKLGEAVAACYRSDRHDNTRDNVLALLRYGKQGDTGVRPALKALQKAFINAVGPDRPGGASEATGEFLDFVNSKRVTQLLAQPDYDNWEPPEDDQPPPGETSEPASDDDALEGAIAHKMKLLRVAREANRRLDEEERTQIALPPTKSLTALLAEPDTPTVFRIDEVAPVDARIICSAQYKAGKSTLVANLLRALVDGDPFLGRFTVNQTCKVVLIDDELSENTLRRWLRDQNIANTDNVEVVSLRGQLSSFDLLSDTCRTQWATRLADLGCQYLILDCLRPVLDASGLDENHDAGKFLVAYDALLTEAGVGESILIHHMGHTNERARGDSRLQDWPDAIWRINRDPEDENPDSPRFFSALGRDVTVPEGRLAYDQTTRRLTYAAGSRSNAKTEAAFTALIGLLVESQDELSGRAIEAALSVEGHKRDAVRKALKGAIKDGFVTAQKGGTRALLHSIAYPCSVCGYPVAGKGERHQSCPTTAEEWSLDEG